MRHLKTSFQSIQKKLSSSFLLPVYGLFALLLILGLYRLNGSSMIIDTASYTHSQDAGQKTSEKEFDAWLRQLFQSQITANT